MFWYSIKEPRNALFWPPMLLKGKRGRRRAIVVGDSQENLQCFLQLLFSQPTFFLCQWGADTHLHCDLQICDPEVKEIPPVSTSDLLCPLSLKHPLQLCAQSLRQYEHFSAINMAVWQRLQRANKLESLTVCERTCRWGPGLSVVRRHDPKRSAIKACIWSLLFMGGTTAAHTAGHQLSGLLQTRRTLCGLVFIWIFTTIPFLWQRTFTSIFANINPALYVRRRHNQDWTSSTVCQHDSHLHSGKVPPVSLCFVHHVRSHPRSFFVVKQWVPFTTEGKFLEFRNTSHSERDR